MCTDRPWVLNSVSKTITSGTVTTVLPPLFVQTLELPVEEWPNMAESVRDLVRGYWVASLQARWTLSDALILNPQMSCCVFYIAASSQRMPQHECAPMRPIAEFDWLTYGVGHFRNRDAFAVHPPTQPWILSPTLTKSKQGTHAASSNLSNLAVELQTNNACIHRANSEGGLDCGTHHMSVRFVRAVDSKLS